MTLEQILREDEIKLFIEARRDDDFMENGYDLYGDAWEDHVPDSINVLFQYLFGIILWRYQLSAYYTPLRDIMVHGARGSGKTDAFALILALWTAFNPGHNWLHTAPTKDQSQKAFDSIIRWGRHAQDGRDFYNMFIVHTRLAPFPDIEIRRWDDIDPSTRFWFRSFGRQGEPMELLRSFEAGRVSADEAFRTQNSDYPLRVLAGCLRGPNHYMMARFPELREEYQDLSYDYSMAHNFDERRAIEERISRFTEEHGLTKRTKFYVFGNVGSETWEWQRFEWGLKNPSRRWSKTWVSSDNPAFSAQQRKDLAQQFEEDPDTLRVEMYAEKPVPSGDVFVAEQIGMLFDGELNREGAERYEDGEPGWTYKTDEKWGLIEYMKPPDINGVYAGGGDSGTGRVPHRNKWVALVARIDRYKAKRHRGPGEEAVPFEIVAFETGNLSRSEMGSITPWLNCLYKYTEVYPMPFGHFAADATGTQKDVHEVAWGSDGIIEEDVFGYDTEQWSDWRWQLTDSRQRLVIRPLQMTAIKRKLIMQTQLILSAGLIRCPNFPILERELASYQMQDTKIAQDTVMALTALTAVIWPIVAEDLIPSRKDLLLEPANADGGFNYERNYREGSRAYRDIQ